MRARTLFVCVLLGSTPSFAAAQPSDDRQSARLRTMDTNRDGVVDRSEWRGSEQSFEQHDWNRDGVLSGDELRGGRQRRSVWPADPDANRPYDPSEQRFRNLDRDRDGQLSRGEWESDAESFRRLDRNRDGVVTRGEFLDADADVDDRDGSFDALDANRDGRVSRDEWHADPVEFGWWDRDRNGVLSRDELMNRAADDAPADLFASLDVNRDAVVTRDEWHWSREAFDRRDTNRDGILTRDELVAPTSGPDVPRTPAYRAGETRGLADGRAAGREDKRLRNRWDLEGQRELEQADAGYASGVGARDEYQAGYRAGFRRGYADGFGPR